MHDSFVLKGNVCYSIDKEHLEVVPQGYLVCLEGICAGVFRELPRKYQTLECKNYGDVLIVPGLVDLHAHAPQYAFRGLGMDLELLNWLNTHTFPEESKYKDITYAKKAYRMYVEDLKKSAVTRSVIFATIHIEATEVLMDMLECSGLQTYVGKVNMDRNAPDTLLDAGAKESAEATKRWLSEITGKYKNTFPILTPRFIPSCTDELMRRIKEIQRERNLPVQSHLSENLGEIEWVQGLCPQSRFYGDAYDQFGLFGGECPTIMAHCVSSTKDEIELMRKRGVFIAHCPQSNANLSSGIAPLRTYLDQGLRVGLGSDMAGGYSTSVFRVMADAIQCSKLRWRLVDQGLKPLTIEEAFYLGTKGGGAFFGKVGSFEDGFEMDAVILDDSKICHPQELTVKERLERFIYLSDDRHIVDKYVRGKIIKK